MMSATNYRHGLPERPARMRGLPLNDKGYPVPWFVEWIGGKPDFRIMDGEKWHRAIKHRLCWLCGEKLGRYLTFVAGPMCGINRTSGEPPCHRECAVYAAIACPFMSLPKALRRDANMPEQSVVKAGAISRNPGVAMLWTTESYRIFKSAPGQYLLRMGAPAAVEWFAEGRVATRAEVEESIRTGMPFLEDDAQREGAEAMSALAEYVERFRPYLPVAA